MPNTRVEGPGTRFAVWAQGCSIRCSGCFNPHLWTAGGGHDVTATELASRAIAAGVEGVTLLGGEPFDQATGFAEFARLVRVAGLSVMTFTGHELEALRNGNAPRGVEALLAETDLLVDGPYRADEPDNVRPWVGSRNQRFHFLSDRYASLRDSLCLVGDRLEVRISPAGDVQVNGWANVAMLDDLLAGTTRPVGRGRVR